MTNREINQMSVFITLKEDMTMSEVARNTSSILNSAVCRHKELEVIHSDSRKKLHYIFSKLKPMKKRESLTEDGILPKGGAYHFNVRAVDKELLYKIQSGLQLSEVKGCNVSNYELITTSMDKSYVPKEIKEVRISSPSQIKYGMYHEQLGKKKTDNILSKEVNLFKHQLNRNSVMKYNRYMNENIPEDLEVFTDMQLKDSLRLQMENFGSKGVTGFMGVNQDKDAIKVATFCINSGIGASNSYMGSGYLDIVVGGIRND